MNKFSNLNQKAFTLAEILISLVIIGIIAVLVLPPLITKVQDSQFRATFKKEYSVLSSAIQQLRNDNGGTVVGVCKASSNEYATFEDLLTPYLRIAKLQDKPGYSVYGQDVWPAFGNFYYYDGSPVTASWDLPFAQYAGGLILNDGISILFSNGYQNCGNGKYIGGDWDGLAPFYLVNFVIDTNGPKKPNVLGKDIFVAYLWHDRLYPYGTSELDGYKCEKSGSYPGLGCAALVLENIDY